VGRDPSGGHVLRFESADGGTRVHLLRREAGPGVGESVVYELLGLWVERQGSCLAITEKGQLRYTNSHHNWRDVASGTAGGSEHRVALDYRIGGGGWDVTLGGGTAPPQLLVPTGGRIAVTTEPGHLPVLVSELMAGPGSGWKDEAGDADPWLELFNPSAEAVDLGGWFLSDAPAMRRRWTFPRGTAIGRHEHLVVAADGQPEQGPLHASFRLSLAGGAIVLTSPAGVTSGERAYPAAGPEQSLLFSTDRDRYEPSRAPSPGTGGL
jgi:hypothetical protein